MKTKLMLPALTLGTVLLALSSGVTAGSFHPVGTVVNATGTVISGVGNATVGVMRGIAGGTAYVLNGFSSPSTTHTVYHHRTMHHRVVHHQ